MNEGAVNKHDYNDDRDLEQAAKSHQQLYYNDTVPGHNEAGSNGSEPSFFLQDVERGGNVTHSVCRGRQCSCL